MFIKKGFNVYIVNYKFNAQSIKNNAAVFSSAIRYVYSLNNKKVVATGISMGGIINRYACALAEQNNNPLPISKFVTIDSPHQGAIISKDFLDWRKSCASGDLFSEYAINNDAAKQMLIYNSYDYGLSHTLFDNEIKSINGDGYPHLVEKIGISFSTTNPNPNNEGDKWLNVNLSGIPHINNLPCTLNKNFNLSSEEVQAGSYLPKINMDPSPIFSQDFLSSLFLSILRPFTNPTSYITQYAYPTFIPHNSSLDIVNGVSKFDKIIVPNTTYFHDQIPGELIENIVNDLLSDVVYIQGKVYLNTTKNIVARKKIMVGSNVDPSSFYMGMVRVINSEVNLKAGEEIHLLDEIEVAEGSDFSAIISNPVVICDNTNEQQVMRQNSNFTNNEGENNLIEIDSISDKSLSITNILNIKILPQPAQDYFFIDVNEEDWYDLQKIELLTPLGQTMELPKTNVQNIAQLPNGMYYIKFYFSSGMIVVKPLVVQR